MSQFITEAFVHQFADNFIHVAQQKTSRLESCVSVESGIKGMSKSINRLGQRTAQRRTIRHADTPINDQPHSTRFVDLFDWEDGDMIDDQDKIRMLTDPQSEYVQAMVTSLNRAKDDVIISSLGGTSRSATGNIAQPTVQRIAVGGTGLTRAKLFQARRMFRQNECDDEAGEELFMLYHAQAINDVLADTQLTSSDFTAVQMLQNGTLSGKWMGFTWVPIERTPRVGTTRFTYAFAKSGVRLGVGENIMTRIGEDPGKGFNVRIYAKMSIGAVSIEEEKVAEIACLDP